MNLFTRIDSLATTRNTTIAFIVYAIVGIVLTIAEHYLKAYSSITQLDFQLDGYTAPEVLRLFAEYGEKGRLHYFWVTVLDTLLPITVALFYSFYYSFTYRCWRLKNLGNILIICAISFMVFDFFENALLFHMLATYPTISDTLTEWSSTFTQMKLRFAFITFGFLPITFLISTFRMIRMRKTTT